MMFKKAAKEHAIKEAPKESCGIVVNDDFAIHPKDFLKARSKGRLQYIVHSHPDGGDASEPDKKACTATKIPWYIYLLPKDTWQTINP